MVRLLSDFLFVWKPYRPKGWLVPPEKASHRSRGEGRPTEFQLELIRKARRSLAKDLPRNRFATLRLPDGSTWPIKGQAKVPTFGERMRALPIEVLGQVLAYLDHRSVREAYRLASASGRERRHLKKVLLSFDLNLDLFL